MTKSSMRSAGLRKMNLRVQRATVDRREQLQARAYESRKERHVRTPEVVAVTKWYRGIVKSVRTFLGNFFRGGRSKSIRNLDLTTGAGRHALFGTGRDAGAYWLRSVFGQNLKMVSTRDGRKV